MIIIRQKVFAEQDYAGAKTALGAKWIRFNRNLKAAGERRQRRRNQRHLEKELGRVGINTERVAITGSQGQTIYANKRVNTGTVFNDDRTANTVAANMTQRYNDKNTRMVNGNSFNSIVTPGRTTTKDRPTQRYIADHTPKQTTTMTMTTGSAPAASTGSKFGQFMKNNGGKMAIGAAAIGAGAYLLHRRNQKKKEAEQAQSAQQQPQQVM